MFADGVTASVMIAYTSHWAACGSDPHGCGQMFTSVTPMVQIETGCSDSGVDAGSSD
jgi:hypothetical protein